MKKVTYFDVEFANSKNKSICQMGLVCDDYVTGDPCFPELNIYVNPEDGFDDMCVKVHGITKEHVKNEHSFPVIWKNIEEYFINTVIIGHNIAGADLDALVKNLVRYNLDIPEFYYICTLELAREYIPSFAVENYKMSTLCKYFDIDIDNAHDAFDDACANADLFKTMVKEYGIDITKHIKKYIPNEVKLFSQFMSAPSVRKSITEFYGIIRGFSIDNVINDKEVAYLKKWRSDFCAYTNHFEIYTIICEIDKILSDGKVTVEEIVSLQAALKQYLDVVASSPVTLATQILDGIMKGITTDGTVTEAECKNLRQWLYDNIYLSGHYPFDKVTEIIDNVLADSVITFEESEYITSVIDSLLNPIEILKTQVHTIEGKYICLSGNFSYGEKADVEKYIIEQGGLIHQSVKKSTDYLVVGGLECQAFSNGTYGTKVKKAIEYNKKGCNIKIVKESDFFATEN